MRSPSAARGVGAPAVFPSLRPHESLHRPAAAAPSADDIERDINHLLEELASFAPGPKLRDKKVQDHFLVCANWVQFNYLALARYTPQKTIQYLIELLKKTKVSSTKCIILNALQRFFDTHARASSLLAQRHIPLFIEMLHSKDPGVICETLILLTKLSYLIELDGVSSKEILPIVTQDFFADFLEHSKEWIQLASVVLFSNLSNSKINREPLSNSKAFLSLLKLIDSSDEEIQLRTIITCSHLSVEVASHDIMVHADALPKILALVEHRHPDIVLRAIVTLGNLANSDLVQKYFRHPKKIQPLLTALSSPVIAHHVMRTIAILSFDEINAACIGKLGGVQVISRQLYKKEDEALKYLIQILTNLSTVPSNWPLFTEPGLLPFLITLIRDSEFAHLATLLVAFSNLSLDKNCRFIIRSLKTMPIFFDLIEFTPSLEIRKYAATSIARLTTDPEDLPLIEGPKQMGLLIRLLQDEDLDIQFLAATAIAQLAASKEFCQVLGEQGGMRTLITITNSEKTPISNQALSAIAMTMRHTGNRKALIESDGLPKMLQLLQTTDHKTINLTLQVLQSIEEDAHGLALLIASGAIEGLNVITRSSNEENRAKASAILAPLLAFRAQLAAPPQHPVKPPKDLHRVRAPSLAHVPFFTPVPERSIVRQAPRMTPREKKLTFDLEQVRSTLRHKDQAIVTLEGEKERSRAAVETLHMWIEEHQSRASSKPALVASERDHPWGEFSDDAMTSWAARMCGTLSGDDESREMLTRLGIIPFLSQLLTHEVHEEILIACLYALKNFTTDEKSAALLVQSCDIDRLIALCSHPQLAIKNATSGVLARLAYHPCYQDMLKEKGALTAIIELVRLEVMDRGIHGQLIEAVWALSFFAYFEDNRTWIERADGISLLATLVHHPVVSLQQVAENALLSLLPSFITLLKTNLTRPRFLQALGKILERLHLDEGAKDLLTEAGAHALLDVAQIKELPATLCGFANDMYETQMAFLAQQSGPTH